MNMNKIVIKLLTAPGCALCAQSYFVLNKIKHKFGVRVFLVDVNKTIEYQKYRSNIPVVLVNEEVACEGKTNETKIRIAIEKLIKN
jgi:Glutaredoxin-like domain (DUF836)